MKEGEPPWIAFIYPFIAIPFKFLVRYLPLPVAIYSFFESSWLPVLVYLVIVVVGLVILHYFEKHTLKKVNGCSTEI